jgi:cobalt/nickel transport system permease protein
MVLTPLGILAAGKAWGEWSPSELAMRKSAGQAASVASNSVTSSAPVGLQRLAKLWTAPFPAYAPTFVKSARFGYFLSAMFAVGILLLVSLVAQLWVQRRREVGHS